MKKGYDQKKRELAQKYGQKFKDNPVASRMAAKNEAKDLGRRMGSGDIPDVLKRK